MSSQLSLLTPTPRVRTSAAYVTQGQERPTDLPRLRESAETMEARVLAWFRDTKTRDFPHSFGNPRTPTDCASGMGLDLTTVRPRICQLSKRTEGPRLERCKWIKRRPTRTGSEGYYRYTEGESK